MHKCIIVNTHGIATIEGTVIHCLAVYGGVSDYVARMVYNESGVLIMYESKHENLRKI